MIQLKCLPFEGADPSTSIFIELYETQPIKLTLSIEDVTSADATSVFSRTFKVPATRVNNIFFKNAFAIDGTDFDVTIKKPAEILVDGAEFKTGHVRLQKIYINEDLDKIDYELLFLGETRDFSSAIGELTMCQLTLTDFQWEDAAGNVVLDYGIGSSSNAVAKYTEVIDQAVLESSWNAYPGGYGAPNAYDPTLGIPPTATQLTAGHIDGDLLFPLIDHGNAYDNNDTLSKLTISGKGMPNSFCDASAQGVGLDVSRFKPMFRSKRIWDQIFQNAGYTYESDFLNSPTFKQMYVSAFGNIENIGYTSTQQTSGVFNAFSGGNGENDVNSYMYCPNIVFNHPNYFIGITDTGSQSGGSYFNSTGASSITPGAEAYYSFDCGAQVDAQQENSDTGYTDIDSRVVLCLVDSVGGSILQTLATGNWATGGNWSSLSFDSRQLSAGDQIGASAIFQVFIESYNGSQSQGPSNVGQAYWHCNAAPGEYNPVRDLDCEYQQIDFIKDIITQFRLVMQPSTTTPNHFIIEPWQDFIGSGDVYDWTSKLIREKDFIAEPLFNTQSSQIEFTHAEDQDFINKFHQDNQKHAYGWLRFDSQNELLKGKREIKVKGIAPTPIDQIVQGGSHLDPEFILPQIFDADGDDAANNPKRVAIKPKTRFLFYNGKQQIDNLHFHWFLATNATAYGYYPLVSSFQWWPVQNIAGDPAATPPVPALSTLTLDFANDIKYYLDPNPGSEYLETPNTLFNNYWGRYISSLYNKFSRKITAYFTLNSVDLQNLTFDDVIFIDGKYYRPEKIIDVQIGNRTAVKCELITLKDQRVFWPNEPLTGFSIIEYDGTCFGDNGEIQVTTNGTPPFTWTITGTGQTGVYNAPVGAGTYIFTVPNVPLGQDELVVVDTFGRTSIVGFTIANNNSTPVTGAAPIVTNPTDCGPAPCNGSIEVTATSGATPIDIIYQDGYTAVLPDTRTGLCEGDYLYYLEDNNGCQSAVETVTLTCDSGVQNYEIRELLNNCQQVSTNPLVATYASQLQAGDVVQIINDIRCYVVIGITQDAAEYQITTVYADCETCETASGNFTSYQVEACDDQGVYKYVDLAVVLANNQVVELVGVQGCWIVRGTSLNVAAESVQDLFKDCASCATGFTYYAYACDTQSFPHRQFDSATQLNVGGVYKIQDGPNAGICVEILQLQDPVGNNDSLNPTQYLDCDDCQGITPPPAQKCTTLNNTGFVNQTYSYTFNGTTYSNQAIGSGQSVTICAEFGSVTVSDPSVQINVSSTTCTSEAQCSLATCIEYIITNNGAIPEGNYKYTDCDGNQLIGTLAAGNSVTVCARKPPKPTAGLDVEATDQFCI